MRKKFFSYASLLLILLPMFGCATMSRIPDQELNKTHNLIIVPFKGTPAMVVANTGWLSAILPVIYVGVEKLSRGGRQEIVTVLNDNFGGWEPSVIVAQECSNLIEKYQTTKIENITIIDSRESRHSEELRNEDPGRFSAKERTIYKWIAVGDKWLESDNSQSYYKDTSLNRDSDWALEIFISVLSIFENKTTFAIIIKLVNLTTGEVITSIGALEAEFSFKASFKLENFPILTHT